MADKTSLMAPPTTPKAVAHEVLPLSPNLKNDSSKLYLPGFPIQLKLSIGAVNDPLEDEADRMANTVMRMPETSFIQRKCATCGEEEHVNRKPLASFIQRKSNESDNVTSDATTSQIQSTRGNGSVLPDQTKDFMENGFGTDFSNVRIHNGSYATQLSTDLNAQAFTVGNDIYFNEGKYAPQTSEGKHLLAHELTHTIQQGNGLKPKIQKKWKIKPRTTGTNPLKRGGQTDQQILENGFKEICPLASRSGNEISIGSGPASPGTTEGCDCLNVIDSKVGTLWTRDPEVQVEPFGWSQTFLGSSHPEVSVRHPEDPFNWGYWTSTSTTHPAQTRHVKPFWQTLAHEICGHVAAFARAGGGLAGARGVGTGHNVAIEGENLVAAEHGVTPDEQRGLDMDPSGTPLAGHRGESFLQATVFDFAHTSDVISASGSTVMNSIVRTVRTAGSSLEMLIQVEGLAHANEGGLILAQSRATNVKNEIIRLLTTAGLLNTSTGGNRFSPDLITIAPGSSVANTSDTGRIVKVYLFHQPHSAGP